MTRHIRIEGVPPGAVLLAAISVASAEAAAQEETVIRMATVPCICFAPLYVAEAKGYLDEAGIAVEPTQVTSGQDGIALVAAGRLDVLMGGLSAGFFNAVDRGIEVRVVASMGGESVADDAWPAVPLIARTALVESGEVTGPADLEGRRVAMSGGIGSLSSFDVSVYLQDHGLTLEDVEVVALGGAEIVQAMENAVIDATVQGGPFSNRLVDSGAGTVIAPSLAQVMGKDIAKTAVVVNPSYLEENREVVVDFVHALARAAADLDGAGYDDPEHRAILAEALGVDERTLAFGRFWFVDALDPAAVDIEALHDVFLREGVLRAPVDYSGVIDPTIHAAVAARLAQ